MGKYIRECKGIGEVAAMEVAEVGVRTRARTQAMAAAEKKRKNVSGELQHRSLRKVLNTLEKPISPMASENSGRIVQLERFSSSSSDHVMASRCSSNRSSVLMNECLRSDVDLEGEVVDFENYTYFFDCRDRRETTPSSDTRSESYNMDSTTKPSEANFRHGSTVEKMPSEEEIDEFFSPAEKSEMKRFTERYNYDFVKDVPLDGRYQWVRLKQ